ncbi:MAG: BON domain-containing protein [Pseudomonadota bacterium]|nr:BON domain-containing protein [Pseudomonadota bacterium]
MQSKVRLAVKSLLLPALMLSLVSCEAVNETLAPPMGDDAVTARVRKALDADAQIRPLQINVDTFDGVVELRGFVDTSDSEAKAMHIAQQVRGVTVVKDDLSIANDPEIKAPGTAKPQ